MKHNIGSVPISSSDYLNNKKKNVLNSCNPCSNNKVAICIDDKLKTSNNCNSYKSIEGPIGPIGATGATGLIGPIGYVGPTGSRGKQGFVGSTRCSFQ
jgi:hypothetical protein